MNEWVICLAGVAVISVLCDLIVPEGTTSKYIKTVIGFLITVTMLVPLAQAFNSVKTMFGNEDSFVQTAFIDSTNSRKFELHCKEFVSLAKMKFGVDVEIEQQNENVVISIADCGQTADFALLVQTAEAIFEENVVVVHKGE